MNLRNQNPAAAAAPDEPQGTDTVRALMAEVGLDDDTADNLASVLSEMRALGAGPLPAPSPAVSALIEAEGAVRRADANHTLLEVRHHRGQTHTGADQSRTLTRRPKRRGRRAGLIALAVAACLGLAGGAAATADEGFRQAAGDAVEFLIGTVTGAQPGQNPETPPHTAPGQDHRRAIPSGPTGHNPGRGEQGKAPSTDHPAPPASLAPRGTEAGNPRAASPTSPSATGAPKTPGNAKESGAPANSRRH